MAADDLATSITMSSAAMILITEDEWVLFLNEDGFIQPVPSYHWEVIGNTNFLSSLWKWIQHYNTGQQTLYDQLIALWGIG